VLVQKQGPAAGAAFENLHVSLPATRQIDDRSDAMAQADAYHHRGRRRYPQPRSWCLKKGLIGSQRRGRRFGW
jgi:hypothetical protein